MSVQMGLLRGREGRVVKRVRRVERKDGVVGLDDFDNEVTSESEAAWVLSLRPW